MSSLFKDLLLTMILCLPNEKQDKGNLGQKGLSDNTKVDVGATRNHGKQWVSNFPKMIEFDEYDTPRGGGGSSIVKVPGDVPPTRVYFFWTSSLAKGILLAILVEFSLGKGMLFGNFGQRTVKVR